MAAISFREHSLTKKVALTISRGRSAGSTSFVVQWHEDGILGLGEAAEFDIPGHEESTDQIESDLNRSREILSDVSAWQRYEIESRLQRNDIGSSVRAAIDMAILDWAGKRTGQPVWRLLGLEPKPKGPISVTIGINTPDGAVARLEKWFEVGTIRGVKIKLGSPAGIHADKAMFEAVAAHIPAHAYVGIDANGGWSVSEAIEMSRWLVERGVVHMEQPLSPTSVEGFVELYRSSALPIFLDESIRSCQDIVRFGNCIHGINIKITKCGGLTEAMRMIATASAFGLQTMVGCYGNMALGNAAAFQLSSLIDYIDLDSHLNLSNDPTSGLEFQDGYLLHSFQPGLGVVYA
jgi:L-Ala-D/L-Glu epimerase